MLTENTGNDILWWKGCEKVGWIIAVFALIIIGLAFYIHFIVKRTFAAFGLDVKRRWVKLLSICLSIVSGLLCANPMSFFVIVVLHVLAFYACLQLLGFVLHKTVGNRRFLSRRKIVLESALIPMALTVLVLLAGYINLHSVEKTHYTVYTDKDIRQEGYRVALIADVHFGVSLDEKELLEKCKEISREEPDIVILCGDIVDNSTAIEEMYVVFSALGSIESKFGIYYVYGNHDRPMSMIKSGFTKEELEEVILSNGITVLKDDVTALTDDFTIVGREDRSVKGRAALAELMGRVDQTDFVLTLDHQPSEYLENGKQGTDLLLSGHTHGGQLFPINYLQKWIPFNDGVYGRYDIDSDTVAIITSGFGTWSYPSKTAGPAEYVIIDIKQKT